VASVVEVKCFDHDFCNPHAQRVCKLQRDLQRCIESRKFKTVPGTAILLPVDNDTISWSWFGGCLNHFCIGPPENRVGQHTPQNVHFKLCLEFICHPSTGNTGTSKVSFLSSGHIPI